jgi:hypothetical protein
MSASDILEWLNSNSSAVAALSALLTAAATVAIAIFSFGTWKVYHLQRASLQASRAPSPPVS